RDLVIPRPSTAAFESQIPQRRLRQSALEAHRSTQSLNSNPIYFERKDVRIISANRVCCKAARETVPVAHDMSASLARDMSAFGAMESEASSRLRSLRVGHAALGE